MITIPELDRIDQSILTDKNLGKALRLLRAYIDEHSLPSLGRELGLVENDYRLMCDFMMRGFSDEKRPMLYDDLLKKAFVTAQNMRVAVLNRQGTGSFQEARSQAAAVTDVTPENVNGILEKFVQDVAMLSLYEGDDADNRRQEIYEEHQRNLNAIFCSIITSRQWTESEAMAYLSMLLSPTIDINDARTLISAIMLSAQNVVDVNKLFVLGKIYLEASDSILRQRALVAFALALPKENIALMPKCEEIVAAICADEKSRRELLELQMQVFYCLEADKDNQTIQRDIMPTLMKNNNFKITKLGIEEKEEDPMQDILHPDAADKAMEELEDSIKRMMDMQKAGADIYFGGFSQMKRFPFFYTFCNWFMPFYPEHPVLTTVTRKMNENRFLATLMEHGPFCDSDKYSFALAMNTVIDRIPANIKEMMDSEQLYFSGGNNDAQPSPAYQRRMYLQDLYRFFRLFHKRSDLRNPFDAENYSAALFFVNKNMQRRELADEAMELERFLLKRKYFGILKLMLDRYNNEQVPDYHYYKAVVAMHNEKYDVAEKEFQTVLQMQPEHARAMSGLAKACFYGKDYEQAAQIYGKLNLIFPDKLSYMLNMSIAMIYSGNVDEGVRNLYKLEYENPENVNMKRALGWGLLYQRNAKQARNIYKSLLDSETKSPEDMLNGAYCAWINGETEEALSWLRLYRDERLRDEKAPAEVLLEAFRSDNALLQANGIGDVEQKIMSDMVGK